MKNQKIITGTSWKRILNEIYEYAPNLWGHSNKMHHADDRHPLAQKLKISGNELMLGVAFLEDNGLIKTKTHKAGGFSANWILTEKGFNVALENQKKEEDKRRNNLIADTSIVLMQIAIIGIIVTLQDKSGFLFAFLNLDWFETIFLGIILGVFLILLIFKILTILFNKESWKEIFFER